MLELGNTNKKESYSGGSNEIEEEQLNLNAGTNNGLETERKDLKYAKMASKLDVEVYTVL